MNKTYEVEIKVTSSHSGWVTVEANSKKEAEALAKDQYFSGDLDVDCYDENYSIVFKSRLTDPK